MPESSDAFNIRKLSCTRCKRLLNESEKASMMKGRRSEKNRLAYENKLDDKSCTTKATTIRS